MRISGNDAIIVLAKEIWYCIDSLTNRNFMEKVMIQEIENRRSIRKYKPDAVSKEILEHIIYSATLAPSAKNRQPWKFIVYQGKEKDRLVDVMRNGINSEKSTHKLMPEWAFAIPDAQNTVRIMQEAPCLIVVLNTNQQTPFANIESEQRIVEICDSLSIGASVENMILTATSYGLGTLWIANTCFAYNDLIDFIGTEHQLTGIVAVGFANENPAKRPRKPFKDIIEYR